MPLAFLSPSACALRRTHDPCPSIAFSYTCPQPLSIPMDRRRPRSHPAYQFHSPTDTRNHPRFKWVDLGRKRAPQLNQMHTRTLYPGGPLDALE